ncbi:hypothetical protein HOLleu_38131 [Holothuria leucospilota]|uniref:Uncharacterized protein n=1 Tax=Holothuria leucospilota TaxID=206669 RepID=A0A9Q1BFU4_HOLLE|nr:hypothetical protein HOLleu_38131 [Holothuria leucospilota]
MDLKTSRRFLISTVMYALFVCKSSSLSVLTLWWTIGINHLLHMTWTMMATVTKTRQCMIMALGGLPDMEDSAGSTVCTTRVLPIIRAFTGIVSPEVNGISSTLR